MEIDPSHIRSLQAVVRYGGYHRAAQALHLTQPAISRHINRLEEQLGQALFYREGRGVRLTAFGERAVRELGSVLDAQDRAIAALLDGEHRPFVLGAVEHVVDPLLPGLLSVLREQIGSRDIQLRFDRSLLLSAAFEHGQLDAAVTFDPGPVEGAIDLGTMTLAWWRASAAPEPDPLPDPVPLVVYDDPCALRELALAQLHALGREVTIAAESTHITGVQGATRAGLGYALLSQGADGLHRVRRGPLAATTETPLWLLLAAQHRQLATPLRAAAWHGIQAGGRDLGARELRTRSGLAHSAG